MIIDSLTLDRSDQNRRKTLSMCRGSYLFLSIHFMHVANFSSKFFIKRAP